MSSIALPALHIQPPPDPSEGIQRMVALKGMLAQQAQQRALMPGQLEVQKQQIQAATQENAIKAQEIKDRDAATAAMQEWDGKDINALPGLMMKHGASAQTVMSTKAGIIKQQQDIANLGKDQLALEKTKNDYFAQQIENVKSLPPEQQPAAFEQAKVDAVKKGHLDPQTAQGMQYQGPEQLDMLEKTLIGHSGVIDSALKSAETAKNTAQAGEATAQTNKINAEISPDNPADPNLAKTKYQGILAKIQASGIGSLTVKDYQWAKAFELAQRKTTTQADSLGVSSVNTSGPSGIAGAAGAGAVPGAGRVIAPQAGAAGGGQAQPTAGGAKQSIVDMVGQYRTDPALLSRMFIKHPEILGQVQQKYPDFDQTNYTAKSALIKGMTSGSQSKEINAVNTAMGHIGALDDAIDALHNGNVTLLNKIGTAYNINVAGKTPEAAFKLIANRVGPEIATAYVAGGGGEHERDAIKADFDVNLPPQTLHNNAAKTVDLLRSKIGALENQYKTTVQRDDFTQRFITPQAQASLQKFAQRGGSQGSGVIYARDPQGNLHKAPAGTPLPDGWKQENR